MRFTGLLNFLRSLFSIICFLSWGLPLLADVHEESDSIIFASTSDTHFGLKNSDPEKLQEARLRSQIIAGLIGSSLPDELAEKTHWEGVIPIPRGLLIGGDLTDGNRDKAICEKQWGWFLESYPWKGLQVGSSLFPIFPGIGNHDGNVNGVQRNGLRSYIDHLSEQGLIKARSKEGLHYALKWGKLHLLMLNLCAADHVDTQIPFRFGNSEQGGFNDPQKAAAFMKEYLQQNVGKSGDPVILCMHYGFDSFSCNDWNWWTPAQRAELYHEIDPYNVIAIIHGHNHVAEHYLWPNSKQHDADIKVIAGGSSSKSIKKYDVFSNGGVCWLFRLENQRLVAVHYGDKGWDSDLTTVIPIANLLPEKPSYTVHDPKPDERLLESRHFVARWPKSAHFQVVEREVENTLATLEEVLDVYLEKISFPSPFSSGSQRTKINVYLVEGSVACGAGKNDYPGMSLGVDSLKRRLTLAHELGHCLQYGSQGLRASKWVNWIWESHANWMVHQFSIEQTRHWEELINAPHIAYGSTRNRYGNWHFFNYLRMKGGNDAVNKLWSLSPRPGEQAQHQIDPFLVMKKVQGWNQEELNDQFGYWAMGNACLAIDPWGCYHQWAKESENQPVSYHREVELIPDSEAKDFYVIPDYWAPQRFGYNKVRLSRPVGERLNSITIDFEGLSPIEGGSKLPSFQGGWRWGVVAINKGGTSRFSELQSSSKKQLIFSIESDDLEYFLVVLGAPPVHEKVEINQSYETIHRFPWRVHLTGAVPFQKNQISRTESGAPHKNGGGWVDSTAFVEESAFVGPNARVIDHAQVHGKARIEGWAVVGGKAEVVGEAVVRDHAYITGESKVSGTAQIGAATILIGKRTIVSDQAVVEAVMNVIQDKSVTGDAKLFGDVELHSSISSGRHSGIIKE